MSNSNGGSIGISSAGISGGSVVNGHRGRGRRMGPYGDYACDSPWALIESAGKAMRPTRPSENIEFILWTGDALSHAHTKMSEARRLVLLQNVTDLISRTFNSQSVYPVVGHDDPATLAQLADLWKRWLPPEAMQTFETGGYYTIEQKVQKLRIVILNTNLWVAKEQRVTTGANNGANTISGTSGGSGLLGGGSGVGTFSASNINSYSASGGGSVYNGGVDSRLEEVGRLQWEWLESVLAKSNRNDETVYLVGHIPPGPDERQLGALPLPHRSYTPKNNERYLAMVRRHHKTIVGQFFGHLHSDTFRIIYNKQGNPISWIMMTPALTPKRINGGANNPGLRLYKFKTDTGEVLDYTQFYLDLRRANEGTESNEDDEWSGWVPEYNLTSWYGLNKITPLSLHNLADRFTQKVPEENRDFERYFIANSVSLYKSPSDGNCDVSCAHIHFCAITRVDYNEYRQCIKTAPSALASAASNGGIITIIDIKTLYTNHFHSVKLFNNLITITLLIILPYYFTNCIYIR